MLMLDDPAVTKRLADADPADGLSISNVRIANLCRDWSEHPYAVCARLDCSPRSTPTIRRSSTSTSATEYSAVQTAYGYSWQDIVSIAVDGVEATSLDDGERNQLRHRIETAATQLRPGQTG